MESHRAKQTFDKHLYVRSTRGITRDPIAHKDVSHARVFFFSFLFCYVFVTPFIAPCMRFGKGHSPTQNQPSNPLLSSFLLQPDKYLEWASKRASKRAHRLCLTRTIEDRNLFQIRHAESVFLSNTSRSGFTWPTFHAGVTTIFLTQQRDLACSACDWHHRITMSCRIPNISQ